MSNLPKYIVGDEVLVSFPENEKKRLVITRHETNNHANEFMYYAAGYGFSESQIEGLASSTGKFVSANERARILNESEQLINGDRAQDYGDPNENFGRIANLWNAQFGHKLSEPFTTQDVAYALIHLKMSRLANAPGHRDSLIDVCGYAALSGELK